MRTIAPGKQLNYSGGSDNEVLFGEISDQTIHSLNTIINFVYKPFTT